MRPVGEQRARGQHVRLAPWRLLLRYSAGLRGLVVRGGLLTLVGTSVSLAQPLLAWKLLSDLTLGRPVLPALAALSVVVLIGAAISACGYYLLERAGETVVLDLRTRLIHRILRLQIRATDQVKPGDLMSRLVADTTLLRQITTQGLVATVTGLLGVAGTLVLMGLLDWVLLLVTLAAVLVMLGTVQWSARRIGAATGEAQAAVGMMAALLDRCLGAFRTVKAAGAETEETERLTGSATQAWLLGLRVARWQAISGTAAVMTLQVTFLLVLGVGGARVAANTIPVSTLIAFMLYLFYLGVPINGLVGAYGQYQAGIAAARRIEQVLGLSVEAVDETTAPPPLLPARPELVLLNRDVPTVGSAAVDFEDVVFSYSPLTAPVHRGVTFSVPPGGMTAIVGPSGAGKSSLFAVVERFYDVHSGRVLVDGVDVREWPLGRLRATIGYVEQDSPALAGTLRENLTMGLGPVPDEQLQEVLARVRLEHFVAALPGGLDVPIGYRGATLSGGERQRIAIARALLRAPRLLLLDEATSQLDAANEQALRDSIYAAAATTTVLVVAHRLSTVVGANQIVVMEAGRVRAIGTHAELLDTDPLYRDLAATQLLVRRAASG